MKKIVLLFISAVYLFAIVSIEPKEIGKKRGVSGEVGVSFQADKGNTDMLSSSISARIEKDKKDSLYFATASYEYATSKGEKSKDRAFLHFRYLKRIDKKNVGEIFAQFQRDEFKDQSLRALLGAGDRYKFYDSKNGRAYFGAGFFYDAEKMRGDGTLEYFRGNFYLSFNKNFNENVKMSFISYYQPRLDEFSDFESVSSLEFSIKLTESLNLLFVTKYDYDSTPIDHIKKYDFTQKMGITYKF